jgi:hypothetical protein
MIIPQSEDSCPRTKKEYQNGSGMSILIFKSGDFRQCQNELRKEKPPRSKGGRKITGLDSSQTYCSQALDFIKTSNTKQSLFWLSWDLLGISDLFGEITEPTAKRSSFVPKTDP